MLEGEVEMGRVCTGLSGKNGPVIDLHSTEEHQRTSGVENAVVGTV